MGNTADTRLFTGCHPVPVNRRIWFVSVTVVGDAVGASGVDVPGAQKKLAEAEAEIAGWKRELDGSYQALLARRDWALAQINAAARQNPS